MAYDKDPGWQYLALSSDQKLKDQSKPFDPKKNVWIPDAEQGFIAAEIKTSSGDKTTCITERGDEKSFKKDEVLQMNPPKFEKTEDMSNLSILNEAAVLHNLRARYGMMLIYTYSGLFCVVINPYKRLPIYSESVIGIYRGKRRNEMPPHLFSVCDEAYRNMLEKRELQSMLITGESGAGKTENTKKVLAYLALVGVSGTVQLGPDGKKLPSLEDQIVMTNPVLEGVGNAKTVRNNNSSRFGKFIRTHFNGQGKLACGDIEHYLLEKSRVIKQAPGERCYHIFYHLCCGAIKGLSAKLLLEEKNPGKYRFINQAELTIDGIDDVEEAGLVDEAMDIMLWPQDEKDGIYQIIAALMHMGQMNFKQRPREEQAESDGTDDCDKACKLWGVSSEDYMKAILKPRVKVGAEWVAKGQNLEQVKWSIGAMAKGLYNRLFDWIVKRCNVTLDAKVVKREYFIGVLDIAGFEIFDFNSFEQLWINFVNEKLQQFFNHHMFVLEQEEYTREGVPWEMIDFGMDLQACIELIEKPMGILAMLDEECIVPKATDLTLASKLTDQHLGKHANFQKPKPPKGKQAEAHFALVHYAGTVRYNTTAWLEKNKDPLNDTCVAVMKTTKENKTLQECWASYVTQEEAAAAAKKGGGAPAKKKGKSAAFATVSMLYREGLTSLMKMLHQTHPHFIRCLIPNELKKSGMLDAALVLNQLTCNGVLEGIRICRKGFPNRVAFPDFKHRYSILASEDTKKAGADPTAVSAAVIKYLEKVEKLKAGEAVIGKTKVFFRAGILAGLEEFRDDTIAKILTSLQSQLRWWLARKEYVTRMEQRMAFEVIQRNVRSWCTLRSWPWFKLYGAVKPLLSQGKQAEEMEKVAAAMKEVEDKLGREEKLRKQLEEKNAKLVEEKNALFGQLQNAGESGSEAEARAQKLIQQKTDLEKQIGELNDRLDEMDGKSADGVKLRKKVETDLELAKKNIQDLEMNLRKQESEKQTKDHQIRSLQDELAQQDDVGSKLTKEKKHQEEVNRKLTDDIQAEEDKVNHMNKVKAKLESTLDEMEDNLEREKRVRQDIEKHKRKLEGDIKVAQETIEEANRARHDMETNIKKKEAEFGSLMSKLEDEQGLVTKLQKQLKDAHQKISEVEEEVEAERQSRARAEKSKQELQHELEEISDRLDEAGGATAAQIELNKKREGEIAKLRRDLEEANINLESQMGSMRKKHNDAVAEMGEQLDNLSKAKTKLEKDKAQIQREVEDLHASVDQEGKSKTNQEKLTKQLEIQVGDLQSKCDDQARQLADFQSIKQRNSQEIADLSRQLEDAESQINALNRIKSQLNSQAEEAKRSLDDEVRERQSATSQLRNYQHECDTLRDQIDEESEGKSELQRLLSKANAETQQWRAKFESEGLIRSEELEEGKRKLQSRLNEMQEQLEAANNRVGSMEKARHRSQTELEDAQIEADRASAYAQTMEKKQKGFDKVVDEWRRKCDDLNAELDSSQREARNLSTEVFKLKNAYDEVNEQAEAVKRENKSLHQEIKDIMDQVGEGGRSVHELQKIRRRLEIEKEELQAAYDEAEANLEAEESKVARSQMEVSQIRQEIEKRIHEKEEEFENTRKNHQRALDSMQASLESEAKGRSELLRMKKKLESDINELEIGLDHANKANADAQKNMKKYHDQIRELQAQVEIEQRSREEVRETYLTAEKRCNLLNSEKEEAVVAVQHADRQRRQAENELNELRNTVSDLSTQNQHYNAAKRKLEVELSQFHSEMEEALGELRSVDEKAKKAIADAARMSEELVGEKERAQNFERAKKSLEQQTKDLQSRLEIAEQAALKGGKRTILKMEERMSELETDCDTETRKHGETHKQLKRQERVAKELQFQVEEDKKTQDRQHHLIDIMQNRLKTYKRQVEEAETLGATNLSKYRQLQNALEDAEQRADLAENALVKMRMKSRTSFGGGLAHSASTTVMSSGRSASRQRPQRTSSSSNILEE